jgi:hypothetical protein
MADPMLVFHIRDDGTAALTKADIGANAIGTFTESGSTVTGLSGYELDSGVGTAPGENSSNPLYIVGIAEMPDNEFDGSTDTRMIWEVTINMAQVGMATADGDGALGEQGA